MPKIYQCLSVFLLLIVMSQCKLYQVVTVFRHGARYPIFDISDEATLPMEGELTAVGMRQHQNLGKLFRQQFIDKAALLSSNFNDTEIQIFSTDYNRTLQSAISHMYGLYPAGHGARLPYVDRPYHIPPFGANRTDIDQQNFALPQGIDTFHPKVDDSVILADCLNWDELVQKSKERQIDQYNEMNMTYYPFLKKLTQMFYPKETLITLETAIQLYDVLVTQKYLGKALPDGFTSDDYKNLQHINSWYYAFVHSGELSHMINTYKFKKIISLFDSRTRIPKTYPTKMTVMSAHDDDIVSLLTDLNLTSSQCIEQLYRKGQTSALNCQTENGFASNLVIQLHSEDLIQFMIKVRSNGKYMKLCGNSKTECDYVDFKSRIKKLMLSNVESICKL